MVKDGRCFGSPMCLTRVGTQLSGWKEDDAAAEPDKVNWVWSRGLLFNLNSVLGTEADDHFICKIHVPVNQWFCCDPTVIWVDIEHTVLESELSEQDLQDTDLWRLVWEVLRDPETSVICQINLHMIL